MRVEYLKSENLYLIHNFLSSEECQQFIARGEATGFDAAPVTTMNGPQMMTDIRNNSRVILDDSDLAATIFNRARPYLPEKQDLWQLEGLNERFRFYRYDPGEKFAPHYDGCFARDNGERSLLTFMLYLNEEFTGGSTKFHEEPAVTIQPKSGQALIFIHRTLHEGSPVLTGRKYVLRTDVMYRRLGSRLKIGAR